MKRISTMVLILTLAGSLLSGCGKNTAQAAESTAAKTVETAESNNEQRPEATLSSMPFPERFSGDWTGLNGSFIVHADAELVLPEADAMPVANVSRKPFSQNDVDTVLEVFLKGNTLYQEAFTKQQAQARLDKYLAMQSGELPLSGDTTEEKLPGLIERYSELVKTAPDEGELIAAETNIDSGEMICGYSEVDGKTVHLFIQNNPAFYDTATMYVDDFGSANGVNAVSALDLSINLESHISEAQAVEIGDALMAELGVGGMRCDKITAVAYIPSVAVAAEPGGESILDRIMDTGYSMEYVRCVNGIPLRYTGIIGGSSAENETFSGSWQYERVQICVSKDGVVFFQWTDPYSEPQIVTDAASLVSFDDVADAFAKMIFVKNSYWENANAQNGFTVIHDVNVDRVELNLMRIRDKNDLTDGTIIPVWDFWGSCSARAADSAFAEHVDESVRYEVVMTINAIDGTMVDRALGY